MTRSFVNNLIESTGSSRFIICCDCFTSAVILHSPFPCQRYNRRVVQCINWFVSVPVRDDEDGNGGRGECLFVVPRDGCRQRCKYNGGCLFDNLAQVCLLRADRNINKNEQRYVCHTSEKRITHHGFVMVRRQGGVP